MQPESFTEQKWGRLTKQPEGYWAFVPAPLPPTLPLDWNLANLLADAQHKLALLSGLARNLPSVELLIGPFVRREAVLSSRIEGTQASLSDLFYFESAGSPDSETSDVREVANYVHAMEHGLHRLATLPISLRLLGELHTRLMAGTRGGHLTPGEFRRTQNWIGPPGCNLNDAIYVPPPIADMHEALSALEKYIHEHARATPQLPALIRLAIIHYQFEAIHPYLDGNGRIGRLLITLILCAEGLLEQPLLYLSAFFEKHRQDYYRLLLAVSQRGEWIPWLSFFLRGIAQQSLDATLRTERLLALKHAYETTLHEMGASTLPIRLLHELFRQPIITIPQATRLLNISKRAGGQNIAKLVKAGILTELSGAIRNRKFAAKEIIRFAESDQLPTGNIENTN